MSTQTPELFRLVEKAIPYAHLIAWDECHKIYLAMDEPTADWFRENYERILESTPEAMLHTVMNWYERSCFLRFVEAVTHNEENPNDGYTQLIPQFADDPSST